MPGSRSRSLHPLLLERSYWRNRLQVLRLAKPSMLLIPRPELSTGGIEVDEFRIRTHDGIRLLGLRARSRIGALRGPARIRVVGPCEAPQVDPEAIHPGEIEFVLQFPAGRRLEDRVLDLLRLCQVAAEKEDLPADQVRFSSQLAEKDEFLIASQLLADDLPGIVPELEGGSVLPDARA